MKKILHKADTRGLANHGWLNSRHTFSFGNYYDPERMGFGALRVINDDVVQPSKGFGTHPHDNMEIISIPLSGSLRHHDSMENSHVITQGEVQIMSAGTGITHSEFNGSEAESVNFLQIWVLPKNRNTEPRYDQKEFSARERQGHFQVIVSPLEEDNGVRINQNAWFSLGDFSNASRGKYTLRNSGNAAYFFLLEGSIDIAGENLQRRDGIGLIDCETIEFVARKDSQILVMDVPFE